MRVAYIYLKQDFLVSRRKVSFETLISDLNYTNDTGLVADCWYDMKTILESLEKNGELLKGGGGAKWKK